MHVQHSNTFPFVPERSPKKFVLKSPYCCLLLEHPSVWYILYKHRESLAIDSVVLGAIYGGKNTIFAPCSEQNKISAKEAASTVNISVVGEQPRGDVSAGKGRCCQTSRVLSIDTNLLLPVGVVAYHFVNIKEIRYNARNVSMLPVMCNLHLELH